MSTESELHVIGGDQSYNPSNVEEAEILPPPEWEYSQELPPKIRDAIEAVLAQGVVIGQIRHWVRWDLQRPVGVDPDNPDVRDHRRAELWLALNEATGRWRFETTDPNIPGMPSPDEWPRIPMPRFGEELVFIDLATIEGSNLTNTRRQAGGVTVRHPFDVRESEIANGGDPDYHIPIPKYDLC